MVIFFKHLSILIAFWACNFQMIKAQNVEELLNQAWNAQQNGDYKNAVSFYTKVLDQEPTLASAWNNRGICRMQVNQYSLATVDFNKAILLDTGIIDAFYNRHLAYRYTKNYQFAFSDISFYINRFPNDMDARLARIELSGEMNDYETEIADLLYCIQHDSMNLSLHFTLLQAYTKSHRFDEALTQVDYLINVYPDDISLYYQKAYIYYAKGKYEESLSVLNLYLIRVPDHHEALKLKADNHFYLKNFDIAEAVYLKILSKDSLDPNILADLGHVYLQTGKFQLADSILTKSIRSKNETPAYAYLGRGIARYNLGLGTEACNDFEKSLRLGETKAQEYLNKYCLKQNTE